MRISGTFCASLTPFNEDYTINNEAFFSHCNKLLEDGADGITVFGSTGEANLISLNAKIESLQLLVDKGLNPNKILPGTGLASMHESTLLSKFVKDLKIKSVLVLPSYYYNNSTDQGIVDYYSNIVEGIDEENFGILLYHIPQLSGVAINFNIIEKLITKYPKNIIGIKDSSNDLDNMINTIKNFPNFCVFSGSDSFALPMMRMGGAGAMTATANVSLKLLSYIVRYAKDESKKNILDEANVLQDSIRKIIFSQEQISFMKAILNTIQKSEVWNVVLPPLISLEDPGRNQNFTKTLELLEDMNKLSMKF